MDWTQMSELKADIKLRYEAKINKLREEMDAALSSLGKVEQTFFPSDTKNSDSPVVKHGDRVLPTRSRRTRFPAKQLITKKPSVITRVRTALASMEGDFTRKDLQKRTALDGHGEIPSNTFSPTFLKLKGVEISTVREPQGTEAGIYRKVDDVKPEN